MKTSSRPFVLDRAMTMIELLVVIAIIAILASLVVPGFGKVKSVVEAYKNTQHLKTITTTTIMWAADNGGRLPSPQYPGGMEAPPGVSDEEFFPKHYNLAESGLWLDGVIFAALYMQENAEGEVTEFEVNEEGDHLKGTFFENTISVKKNPEEENWHRHSYAMNANLQYDRIYDQVGSSDPYLTEKTMSNLIFSPKAMLYIDCIESNVVRFEDRQLIVDTIEERWNGGKAIVTFLDGHAERLQEKAIPDMEPASDRESSRFWRGVDVR